MRHNEIGHPPGKHCHNCEFLEYFEGEDFSTGGFVCNSRNYDSTEEESRHLNLLDKLEYRLKGKRCFKQK